MYKAEILADSISPHGDRLTTMKITFPRFILAEMNTHRMFSRNSASSRAIPFKKMVKMVQENPFIPIAWQKDHKGMQGTEYFNNSIKIESNPNTPSGNLLRNWHKAKNLAIEQATKLHEIGLTKQLCNRLLEPFMWHTVIVTATEWENFFKLRCPIYRTHKEGAIFRSRKEFCKYFPEVKENLENNLYWLKINQSQADIHIQAIAELMWDALNESKPQQLQAGEWHIPFGDKVPASSANEDWTIETLVKISTARNARISYETLGDNPKIDYEADIKLHDRLLLEGHMSPLEHCARVMTREEYMTYTNTFPGPADKFKEDIGHQVEIHSKQGVYTMDRGWCRNFKGFIQYRHLVENN